MVNEQNNTADRELKFSRLLDAPVELVWEVWTNPEHLRNWWGPDSYYTSVAKIDVRKGGEWDLIMRGSDGIGHHHHCVYTEVVKHKKMVIEQNTHFKYVATIEFESRGSKTFLTWTIVFESKEYLEHVAKTIGVANGFKQHTARLVAYMNDIQTNSDRCLWISRILDAPIELVWKVWTKPEHLKNWWGPNGFTNTIIKMDVQTGGEWNLVMHAPDGKDFPNRSIFKEIVEHKKIVYQHFAPNFIAAIQFESLGEKTYLKWQMLFESKELFENVLKHYKADEGLKQNAEKLETYLSHQNNKK